MENVKKLGLAAALAATSLLIYAGAASASTFTSPQGMTYASPIQASATNISISGSFVTVTCKRSELTAKVEKYGTYDAGGEISTLDFSECNFPVKVNSGGSLDVDSSDSLDLFDTQFTIETSVGTCVFTADSALFGGSPVGTLTEGSPAAFDFAPGEIPRTGGNFLCGKVGHWLGTYTVSTPKSLLVD